MKRLPCPNCKTPTSTIAEHRPFCSARCKDVDLGNWLGEAYRITRPMMMGEIEAVDEDTPVAGPSDYLDFN
jgi:endogenous inhibitor of DNA gyrase (YacG/DUF329 family)